MNDLDARIIRAEHLLFRVAAALRRVPFEEGTKDLHLRALKLKAALRELRAGTNDAADSEWVFAQIDDLLARAGQHERS